MINANNSHYFLNHI